MRPVRRLRAVVGWLGEVAFPRRTGRAVPFGRTAILTVFAAAAIFVAYSLSKQGFALPFLSHRFTIRAEMINADGLDAANDPSVSVAGVPEGTVTGVSYDRRDGRAIVTMSINDSAQGRIFRDASLQVRPFNAINIMMVDIRPGDPASGSMPGDGIIPAAQTSIPVASDQFTDMLDSDTRAYLAVLTEQAAVALKGRGGELAQVLAELGPLWNQSHELSQTLAQRRTLIEELVGEVTTIFATLQSRSSQLATALNAGSHVLSVSAAHQAQLAAATTALPGLLAAARSTSASLLQDATPIEQALSGLTPATAALAPGLRAARTLIPSLSQFLDAASTLTHGTRSAADELPTVVSRFGAISGTLARGTGDIQSIVQSIVDRLSVINKASAVISGVGSVQDQYGVMGRFKLLGLIAPTPADFGLAPSAAERAPGSRYSTLQLMLASALDTFCRRVNPLACIARFAIPGLPGSAAPLSAALNPASIVHQPAR